MTPGDPHDPDAPPGALPTASLPHLHARADVLLAIRSFFQEHHYLEVETPLLSSDVCVDAWLEPFEVHTGDSGRLFLQTSPEFHMKRMLAAGAERIYQLTRSFRAGERGARHNPEFTILEWYAVGETCLQQMEFVEELVRTVASAGVHGDPNALTRRRLPPRDTPFRRMGYDAAFAQFAGTKVLELGVEALRGLAEQHAVPIPATLRQDDRDGWLNLLLSAVVEPQLTREGPVFIHDYPPSQAALARVRVGSLPVAERFELYLDGIEICNGYQELTDPDEFKRRMQVQSARRRQEGLVALPVDSRLQEAMSAPGLPDCAGVALGVDRLVMWRLQLERLDQVVAFPADRA